MITMTLKELEDRIKKLYIPLLKKLRRRKITKEESDLNILLKLEF
ncbi:hypothetical protein [Metabacillus fastidiosus]